MGALACLALFASSPSWAEPSKRQEALGACSAQAREQSLSDEAYAQFMRGCLKRPAGAKEPAFAASNAVKASTRTVRAPALTQPASASK